MKKKRIAAKGDRLNWTPLKDVKPINLSDLNLEGKVVVFTNNPKAKSGKLIVP